MKIEYRNSIEYNEFLMLMTQGQQKSGAHCSTARCCNGAERGPRAPENLDLKPKDVKGKLAGMNTIAHAEIKMTEETMVKELQEMRDEADRNDNGEANDEEFLQIMKKTEKFVISQLDALRAPGPSATPSPSGILEVSSPPKRCCTPPNRLDGHTGADHPLAEASNSFGEIPGAQQLQLRPLGLDGVLPNPVPADLGTCERQGDVANITGSREHPYVGETSGSSATGSEEGSEDEEEEEDPNKSDVLVAPTRTACRCCGFVKANLRRCTSKQH